MRGADEPATAAPADTRRAPATLREDRHYIRRMQGLYHLLAPDATTVVEDLPALRPAAAGAL
jgi:hypothetical protein